VGDILLVRLKNGEPFSGVCMNIRRRGVDTGILLRNQLTRVGVEMWYKIYSPNVTGIEVVQRREKKARRARLYYLRYVLQDHDIVWCRTNQFTGSRSMIWDLWKVWFDNTSDSALCLVRRSPNATSIITRRRRTTRSEDERQSSIFYAFGIHLYKMYNSMGRRRDRHVAQIGSQTSRLHGSSKTCAIAGLLFDRLFRLLQNLQSSLSLIV
jgi:hypothetical protein